MTFTEGMELVGRTMDVAGVAAIVVGALVAALLALSPRRRYGPDGDVLGTFRRRLGRAILLGLELLVAADIIRTVAISPTFESVAVLGLIVLIRTFLSWSLELEISGRWPWQKRGTQQGTQQSTHPPDQAPTPTPSAVISEPRRERHDGGAPA
ncbi:DUF1622 domain-containing protein [Dietzia sp. PP-33]|jgi:uncharacterized membrane protein|uniref:DUF1622 domain-containing protein n=1 Tax=Dietzia sp. PP-33 TaxID=2957500 RepID=UPI0029BB96D2|nr:DUF1622 domain-containing protein [Dietzia sp. PP-33]MDX2357655.1 DUF1622 domain-containing protein [Dietzia sp. PP-33]